MGTRVLLPAQGQPVKDTAELPCLSRIGSPWARDDAFTAAEQAVMVDELSRGTREVAFVNAWEDLGIGQDLSNDERAVFVWVGPLVAQGDGFWAGAGMWCGGLCGHGGTYVLENVPEGWRVSGNVPGTGVWIS